MHVFFAPSSSSTLQPHHQRPRWQTAPQKKIHLSAGGASSAGASSAGASSAATGASLASECPERFDDRELFLLPPDFLRRFSVQRIENR